MKKIIKKKLREVSDMPNLTDDEKIILKNLDNYWKYIVRDSNQYLYVYSEKPHKFIGIWCNGNNVKFPFNHLFQFIKCEDDEPYLIEDLLKE